jgi:hypothetical protein
MLLQGFDYEGLNIQSGKMLLALVCYCGQYGICISLCSWENHVNCL